MNKNLPTLPKSLLDVIGEYGMARTDGASPLDVQHRWELLIAGIKDYAASVSAKLPWDERIFALYKDALEVFDGPETPQAVRDVIEWYHGSLLATQPPQDERSLKEALQYGVDIHTPGRVDGPTYHHVAQFLIKANTALAASAPAQQAGQSEPTKTALAIMHELLETTLSEMPSFDRGKEAQEAWADRRAKARNDAAAFLAVAEMGRNKEPGEAIAEICSTYELHWVGAEPVAEICRRTGAKVGDRLYLASTPPQPVAAEAITEEALAEAVRNWFPDRINQAEYFAAAVFGHPKNAHQEHIAAMAGTGSDESKENGNG